MFEKTLEEKLYDCFLDLQRAATSYYLAPRGKTHRVFLKHSRKILEEFKEKKIRQFWREISKLEKETSSRATNRRKIGKLADKILTLGVLLKP